VDADYVFQNGRNNIFRCRNIDYMVFVSINGLVVVGTKDWSVSFDIPKIEQRLIVIEKTLKCDLH